MTPLTVDQLMARARTRLQRVSAQQAAAEVADGALIIDIRSETQRERDGVVPGALYLPRNVLEWRCDPRSEARHPEASDPGRKLIVMCDAGYASSLAAATLQELGREDATDLIGGFQAWRAAGLPVQAAD